MALKKKKKSKALKKIIGRREWASLPELGVRRVIAKIDTGALTSSIHVEEIEYLKENGIKKVRFKVHPVQHSQERVVICVARLVEKRWIKSSNGHRSLRPVIHTKLKMGDDEYKITLTLTSRDSMGYRMLLGREAFGRKYLVDASRSFLAKKKRKA